MPLYPGNSIYFADFGSVSAPSYSFLSDDDTGVYHSGTNQLGIAAGAVDVARFGSTTVVINDGGSDVDFRIEGDAQPNLFVVDAGTDHVSVTSTANTGKLTSIASTVTTITSGDTDDLTLEVANTVTGSTISDHLVGRTLRAKFTNDLTGGGDITTARCFTMQTNTVSGSVTTEMIHLLLETGAASGTVTTGIGLYIAGLQGTTIYGIRDIVTNSIWANVSGGIVVGSPTGGYKGAGTLNAQAVYDDNTLLSDYVFDLAYDGQLTDPEDIERHSKKVLLSIDETEQFVEANRHLPTMAGRMQWKEVGPPSIGKMLTQLWETIERQQLHIFDLHDRLKRLEA